MAESSSFQRGQSQRWFRVMESVAGSARKLGRNGEGEAVLRRSLERYRTLSIESPANFSYIETEARISILLIRFLEDQPSPLEAIQVGINALNRLYHWVAQDRTLATARSLFAELAGLTARLEGERLGRYQDAAAHLTTAIGTIHGPPVQNLVDQRREYQFRIRHALGEPEAVLEYVDRIRNIAKPAAGR